MYEFPNRRYARSSAVDQVFRRRADPDDLSYVVGGRHGWSVCSRLMDDLGRGGAGDAGYRRDSSQPSSSWLVWRNVVAGHGGRSGGLFV